MKKDKKISKGTISIRLANGKETTVNSGEDAEYFLKTDGGDVNKKHTRRSFRPKRRIKK